MSAESVQWRVVRDDGEPVPMLHGTDREDYARLTLKERLERGTRHPYSLQRRTVTVGDWEDAEEAS